jgi:hypothetical protein
MNTLYRQRRDASETHSLQSALSWSIFASRISRAGHGSGHSKRSRGYSIAIRIDARAPDLPIIELLEPIRQQHLENVSRSEASQQVR